MGKTDAEAEIAEEVIATDPANGVTAPAYARQTMRAAGRSGTNGPEE
jgi:hypothetical protein